jgi:hypothetical protein
MKSVEICISDPTSYLDCDCTRNHLLVDHTNFQFQACDSEQNTSFVLSRLHFATDSTKVELKL